MPLVGVVGLGVVLLGGLTVVVAPGRLLTPDINNIHKTLQLGYYFKCFQWLPEPHAQYCFNEVYLDSQYL